MNNFLINPYSPHAFSNPCTTTPRYWYCLLLLLSLGIFHTLVRSSGLVRKTALEVSSVEVHPTPMRESEESNRRWREHTCRRLRPLCCWLAKEKVTMMSGRWWWWVENKGAMWRVNVTIMRTEEELGDWRGRRSKDWAEKMMKQQKSPTVKP